jgi:histidyl-tRNA synthetase
MGDAALEKAMELSKALREYGYYAEYDMMGRGLKAQMKYANKIGAAFTVVLGDNELEQGKAKLKEMEKGDETEIALNDKFAVVFEEIYFNKIMDVMDGESADGNLFSFMGGEK